MRFIHTADLHADQVYHARSHQQVRDGITDNLAVITSISTVAAEQGVDALIIGGDNFANGKPSPESVMSFVEALQPSLEAGVEHVIIGGNHERLRVRGGERTTTSLLGAMIDAHVVESQAELVRLDCGLQVGAVPWAVALPGESDDEVLRRAMGEFEQLCTEADASAPFVLTSHLAASGAGRGSERDLTALFREPVFSAQWLSGLPSAYVALGHIHRRQELADGVWYSGSPQRFTFTDEHDDKGFNLVTVSDDNKLVDVEEWDTEARVLVTIDLESDDVDIPEGAVVRCLLREGERAVPPSISDKVAAAGSTLTTPVRRKAVRKQRDTEQGDPLARWLCSHRPEVAEAALALWTGGEGNG